MMKLLGRRGFTIVELVIIITVIGILATIAIIGFGRFQDQTRDAERSSDIAVVAEALEKYYDKNGEYPPCSVMTGTSASIETALGIDKGALTSPSATADNSFVCSDSATAASGVYNYGGDGSAACTGTGACLSWTIRYRSDETGATVSVTSRRNSGLTTSGTLSLTAQVISNTQINLSWNSIPNTLDYLVEWSTVSNFSSLVGSATVTAPTAAHNVTGLSSGITYYFRVTPRNGTNNGTPGTASATTTISAPVGTLATNASLQSGNTIARGAASGVTCSGGSTLEYTIGSHARNTNVAVSITYPSWGTATTVDVAAAQGYNYSFRAKARCTVGANSSSEVVSASTPSVSRPISAPSAPSYTGDASWFAGYKYSLSFSSSCPSGTSLVGGSVEGYDTGLSGSSRTPSSGYYTYPREDWWYLGWNVGQVWEDVYYYGTYRCSSYFETSPYSAETSVGVTVDCEVARRSFSASPRCDNYGQSGSSLPWGP